jgi:uncharacterized membrane protein
MLDYLFEDTIDAPIEIVFDLISDLSNYKQWNPFVTVESGIASMDEVISGQSFLGKMTVPYRHKIYEFTPNKTLRWRDFGLLAIAVCGDRSRYIQFVDGITHYQCHLIVSGPLSFAASWLFGEKLRQGITAEFEALKREARKGQLHCRHRQ